MKIIAAVALSVVLTSPFVARASSILSASVSNTPVGGPTCSQSASSSPANLSCGSGFSGSASLMASVSDTAGSASMFLSSFPDPLRPGFSTLAIASVTLSVNDTFILPGSGFGYITWSNSSTNFGEGGGATFTCLITVNAVAMDCDAAGSMVSGSFLVPEGVPVSVAFAESMNGGAADADGVNASFDFAIGTMTPAATPESASWILVGSALLLPVWKLGRRPATV